MPKGVILLSGGLDSATLATMLVRDGAELIALSFDYGQRHRRELEAAKRVAEKLHLEHQIIRFDLAAWQGSPLTGGAAVPLDRSTADQGIAPTYVPARNLTFLSFAVGLAETRQCDRIYIGAHGEDRNGYPDCRDEFFSSLEKTVRLGTRYGAETGRTIHIMRPFVSWSKSQIVQKGLELGIDYRDSWTCYQGHETACGRCDSCRQRLSAFTQAGAVDPLPYDDRKAIYLCGAINGCTDSECKDWREEAKRLIVEKLIILDPMARDFRGKEDQSVNAIVEGDLSDIERADILLVNAAQPSWGSAMEIRIAWQAKKAIHLIVPEGQRISPWLRFHATEIHSDLSSAVAAVLS